MMDIFAGKTVVNIQNNKVKITFNAFPWDEEERRQTFTYISSVGLLFLSFSVVRI